MGLWLEHRDDKGTLLAHGRFVEGTVRWIDEGLTAPPELIEFNLDEARQLARFSSHLPTDQRDWVLRIRSDRKH